MTKIAFIEKLRNGLRAFRRAEGGNVAMMFALTIIPIIGSVGAAVDYSRANAVKASMQSAVDATALMLSKEATSLTNAQMATKATDYFKALFNHPEATGVTITPTFSTSSGTQLVVNGAANVATTFMKILGQQSLAVNVSSTVKWGTTRLRVALALDNTGSMSSAGKMTALKTAAKALLLQLQTAASQNGDVYVSIIPFSKDVNVDKVNYTQSWVRWDLWDAANSSSSSSSFSGSICYNGQLWQVNGSSWSYGGACSTPSAGICYQGTLWNWNGTTFVTNGSCGGSSTIHNTWNGCVTDRDQDYDTRSAAPVAGTAATLFPAEQYSSCPVPLMGLSYDWIALNNKIDAMQPDGNTNQGIGLAWAWHSLVAGGPLTVPPKDANYKYNEVIILLSDGLNTQNRWYSDQASIDARQRITCTNVKASGITLYTVHVNTDGDPTSQLLRDCASDPSKFFILTSASAIGTTFNLIGTQLSNLRVAR